MLINKIRNSYRDLIRYLDPVEAIITLDNSRPAANAEDYGQPEIQARRLRYSWASPTPVRRLREVLSYQNTSQVAFEPRQAL